MVPHALAHTQPRAPHFEPSLDASSLRSDIINSIKILCPQVLTTLEYLDGGRVRCALPEHAPARVQLALVRGDAPLSNQVIIRRKETSLSTTCWSESTESSR